MYTKKWLVSIIVLDFEFDFVLLPCKWNYIFRALHSLLGTSNVHIVCEYWCREARILRSPREHAKGKLE